jgi:putative phosphoribosyl transferase
VILVDDGLATGSSMWAAVTALRKHAPAHAIVAVPVGALATCEMFNELTDETVCARAPVPFHAVGNWYADFSQTTDDEVRALLARNVKEREARHASGVNAPGGAEES